MVDHVIPNIKLDQSKQHAEQIYDIQYQVHLLSSSASSHVINHEKNINSSSFTEKKQKDLKSPVVFS
uniref:Uncharacterized protein n=1 Tax=Rhizophora mucronata TaxID=61149 RepID=A0A2P2NDJ9_RHIMU